MFISRPLMLYLLSVAAAGTTAFTTTSTHLSFHHESTDVSLQAKKVLKRKHHRRAQIEQSLDESMGMFKTENWRTFRSRLIDQIQTEQNKEKVTLQYIVENHDPYAVLDDEVLSVRQRRQFLDAEVELETLLENDNSDNDSRHQWVHRLTHLEPGCLLVSSGNGDGRRTVVLITDHDETIGSTKGVIVNMPMKGVISDRKDHHMDISLQLAFSNSPVAFGGPMAMEEFTILHGSTQYGSNEVSQGIFVDTGKDMKELKKVARRQRSSSISSSHGMATSGVLFMKGHMEWSPQELSKEICNGEWYIVATSSDFLLGHVLNPHEKNNDLWSDILERIR